MADKNETTPNVDGSIGNLHTWLPLKSIIQVITKIIRSSVIVVD